MARRVAVIGAGVTGLVAARVLARRGVPVEVFERWPDVGGQASAFDLGDGVWLERYYHHLFASDREMIALHEELLPGDLEWHRSSVGMYARGRIWPFVTPIDLLRYGALPLLDRVRLGIAVLRLLRMRDAAMLDRTRAVAWLRRACGPRALTAVWGPLMFGKFGDDAEEIPLAWFVKKLTLRREKLAGRGAGAERLGYPRSSFQTICRAIADDIRAHGGEIHLDRSVVSVEKDGDGFTLRCAAPGAFRTERAASEDGREARADAVVFTTPTNVIREIAEWPAPFAARLDEWRYASALVLLLELAAPFSDTYWTNVVEPGIPFLALIEHTNLVPAERYPARYLYVSNYLPPGHPLLALSATELLRAYLPGLRRIRPGFDESQVKRSWAFREPAAQPIPRTPNAGRLLPMRTPIAGAYLANTTQIYPEDRGTNYSVRLGREAGELVAGDLAAR